MLATNLHFAGLLLFQKGLNGFVLGVEVAHVHHEVLDDEHMGQRGDFGDSVWIALHLCQAGQAVAAINVHGT